MLRVRASWLPIIAGMTFALSACTGTEASPTATGAHTPTAGATASPDGGDEFLAEASTKTEARTSPQTTWNGPTSGPKPEAGTSIVVVATDLKNATSAGVARAIEEIGPQIGWEITVMDGKGTADGQLAAVNQAIALNPDGIIGSGLDAASYQEALCGAADRGIPFVGFHATGTPGPHEDLCVFWSVSQDPAEIGQALADFVVADSSGNGTSTVLYDANYAIARLKAENMRDQFAKCSGCKLLDYENSPLSDVTTRTPQLFNSWVQEFDEPWYVMTIADFYFDFAAPALRDAGVTEDTVKLVGSDGTDAAYERIRAGEYQVATVPVPERLEAFQTVDEMIRALAGEDPSGYLPPVYVVTRDNVDQEGGDQNRFDPTNDYEQHYFDIWGVSG